MSCQRNPATGAELEAVASDPISRIEESVKAVREVQPLWASLSFQERAKHVRRVKAFLANNAERASCIISSCTGKTRQDALACEVLPCVMGCDWYADNTAKVLAPQRLPMGSVLFANKTNTLEHCPMGVVGIISPWNYPFSIPFLEVIMALMAGNAVVLKVATQCTVVGKFIEECIAAGGFPARLFAHCVVSGAEAGPAMLAAGVNKLFFTGSVRVGKELMAEAAKTLTPVSLELGGNDPMIVLADADLERAVNGALWAGFQNAGQSCGGVERIYVHRSIYPQFLEQLVVKTKALRHGVDAGREAFAVDMGSISTKGQLMVIRDQVDAAVAAGAVIAAQSTAVGDVTRGYFYPATVLTHVDHSMRLMREETFGPVLPVMAFDTEVEAVQLANDCSLGLTSSVWSKDRQHAVKIAHQMQSGVVSINDHLYSHGMSEAPWGGWKESGTGRTHGYLGLKEMVQVRCINEDWMPGVKRDLWWFPFSSRTYSALLDGVAFLGANKLSVRLLAGMRLLRFAIGWMFSAWHVVDPAKQSTVGTRVKNSDKKGAQPQ